MYGGQSSEGFLVSEILKMDFGGKTAQRVLKYTRSKFEAGSVVHLRLNSQIQYLPMRIVRITQG